MHDEIKAGKFIVFKIADYLLALPISDVLKVLNCSSQVNMELRTMGVVQLGRHLIRVLDLHQHFSYQRQNLPSLQVSDLPQKSANKTFLVITQDQEGELCGISVDEPPEIVEIPHHMVRSLPKSDRYSKDVLNIVSHAAILSHEDVSKTIFILNLKQVPNTV